MELECVWFFVLDFPPAAGGLAKFKVVTALEPAILSVAVETPKESVLSILVVERLCARVRGTRFIVAAFGQIDTRNSYVHYEFTSIERGCSFTFDEICKTR